MKKIILVFTVILLSLCCSLAFAQSGKVIFCTNVSDEGKPQDPGTEFTSNVISCLFANPKGFAVPEVVITLYKDEERTQQLLHREQVSINPEWNNLILQNIPLPDVGKYTFSLASMAGEVFASGQVVIKEKTVDQPIPETNEITGSTVADAFNKFINQAK